MPVAAAASRLLLLLLLVTLTAAPTVAQTAQRQAARAPIAAATQGRTRRAGAAAVPFNDRAVPCRCVPRESCPGAGSEERRHCLLDPRRATSKRSPRRVLFNRADFQSLASAPTGICCNFGLVEVTLPTGSVPVDGVASAVNELNAGTTKPGSSSAVGEASTDSSLSGTTSEVNELNAGTTKPGSFSAVGEASADSSLSGTTSEVNELNAGTTKPGSFSAVGEASADSSLSGTTSEVTFDLAMAAGARRPVFSETVISGGRRGERALLKRSLLPAGTKRFLRRVALVSGDNVARRAVVAPRRRSRLFSTVFREAGRSSSAAKSSSAAASKAMRFLRRVGVVVKARVALPPPSATSRLLARNLRSPLAAQLQALQALQLLQQTRVEPAPQTVPPTTRRRVKRSAMPPPPRRDRRVLRRASPVSAVRESVKSSRVQD